MAYLEVSTEETLKGRIAKSANGKSLARSNGCLAFFIGSMFPVASEYFSGLEYEGWTLVSTQTSNTIGLIDGMPFASSSSIYIFQGNGRFEVEWDENGRWKFIGYRYDSYEQEYL